MELTNNSTLQITNDSQKDASVTEMVIELLREAQVVGNHYLRIAEVVSEIKVPDGIFQILTIEKSGVALVCKPPTGRPRKIGIIIEDGFLLGCKLTACAGKVISKRQQVLRLCDMKPEIRQDAESILDFISLFNLFSDSDYPNHTLDNIEFIYRSACEALRLDGDLNTFRRKYLPRNGAGSFSMNKLARKLVLSRINQENPESDKVLGEVLADAVNFFHRGILESQIPQVVEVSPDWQGNAEFVERYVATLAKNIVEWRGKRERQRQLEPMRADSPLIHPEAFLAEVATGAPEPAKTTREERRSKPEEVERCGCAELSCAWHHSRSFTNDTDIEGISLQLAETAAADDASFLPFKPRSLWSPRRKIRLPRRIEIESSRGFPSSRSVRRSIGYIAEPRAMALKRLITEARRQKREAAEAERQRLDSEQRERIAREVREAAGTQHPKPAKGQKKLQRAS